MGRESDPDKDQRPEPPRVDEKGTVQDAGPYKERDRAEEDKEDAPEQETPSNPHLISKAMGAALATGRLSPLARLTASLVGAPAA